MRRRRSSTPIPQSGTASPEYQQAAATYTSYAAKAYQSDMPSAFALSLANIFGSGGIFDLSTTFGKVAVYGGALLAAYVLLPRIVSSVGGREGAGGGEHHANDLRVVRRAGKGRRRVRGRCADARRRRAVRRVSASGCRRRA